MNSFESDPIQSMNTADELAKFVLIIPQKISSVRAEIRALTKVSLAEEVLKQKKEEMQALTEAYLDASVKVGELLLEIPKGTRSNYPNAQKSVQFSEVGKLNKPKGQVISEMGLSSTQAHRFQMLAQYPDIVENAKTESRKSGEALSMQKVIRMIKHHRNACRVDAKDVHQYSKDELTDCKTFDRKSRAKAEATMTEDGNKLNDFIEQGRELTIDSYHLDCYLRSTSRNTKLALMIVDGVYYKVKKLRQLLEEKSEE